MGNERSSLWMSRSVTPRSERRYGARAMAALALVGTCSIVGLTLGGWYKNGEETKARFVRLSEIPEGSARSDVEREFGSGSSNPPAGRDRATRAACRYYGDPSGDRVLTLCYRNDLLAWRSLREPPAHVDWLSDWR